MKSKILALQICLAILCFTQIAVGQKTISNICVTHPNPLISKPAEVYFSSQQKSHKSILVKITNPSTSPVKVGKLYIDGTNKDRCVLQSAVRVALGSTPGPETISNTTIPPNGSAFFNVVLANVTDEELSATIH